MSLARLRLLKVSANPDQKRCMDFDQPLELFVSLTCNMYLPSWPYSSRLLLSAAMDKVSTFCYALTLLGSGVLQWAPVDLGKGKNV